jgi:plastocyanin
MLGITKPKKNAIVLFVVLFASLISINANAQTVDVSIPGFSFDPDTVVITVGMTVQWTNNHSIAHTTTSVGGFWDSGSMPAGGTYSFDFAAPGVYDYFCSIHPSMTGTVIVLEEYYDIPTLYESIDLVDGQEVNVFGEFSAPEDSKLVTSYSRYLKRELMPENSIIFLDGVSPSSDYWYGGGMVVTGIISTSPNPNPTYPDDTLFITITASSYVYLIDGKFDPSGLKSSDESGLFEPQACDPCKFAILISGGGDAADNHPGFWEDVENLYEHKVNNEDYCPENIEVIYFEGDSENTAAIPDSQVASATQANVQAAHEEIARKIAECTRNGDSATVQKMVSNHGEDGDGIVLLGDNYISGSELREFQQMLIDSCCKFMYDEMTQCFGGQIIDSLQNLDDKGKTEMHMNSASGSGSLGWGDGDGSPYLLKKIERLAAGDDYESAVDSARDHYRGWLEDFRDTVQAHKDRIQEIRDSIGDGHPLAPLADSILSEDSATIADLDDSIDDGSPSWVRYQFKKYCEWKKIVAPPGGQFKLKFKGTGGCGNISIYKEYPNGDKQRVKRWNWNLPGSIGYQPGNEERTFNVPLSSNGVYWIHNDNGEFTLTVISDKNQDGSTEAPSNANEFAGASAGGDDGSSSEFGDINSPTHYVPLFDQDGFSLPYLPQQLGPCGGVQYLQAGFLAEAPNPWWENMEVYINVLDVMQPGELTIECPTAEYQVTTLMIAEPGEYTVHLGLVYAPAEGQIIFNAADITAPCFTFDSWALRTLVPTWEHQFLCGDANADLEVNVSDAVWIINYVFVGGDPPMPLDAGDVNCDGDVNVSDAVWIINYVFVGGAAPCECK